MEKYLRETYFLDFLTPAIFNTIAKLNLSGDSDVAKAIRIFYFVRDSFKYSIKAVQFSALTFRASHTIQQNISYCIPKAILLASLARSQQIPSRLHFVDFINHRLSEELRQLWGTNLMAGHCYTELYLNDKWVKATPSLDIETCKTHDFIPVEFNGKEDALLQSTDTKGRPHVEYANDHGTFDDLPIETVYQIFRDVYGPLDTITRTSKFQAEVSPFAKE